MVKLMPRGSSRVLRIRARSVKAPIVLAEPAGTRRAGRDAFTQLLGYILLQAFTDGMSAIRISTDPETRSIRLAYRGLSNTGDATWWEMTPPPPETYGPLIRAIIEAGTFGPTLEPNGRILAVLNGRSLEISVHFPEWRELTLSWTPPGRDRRTLFGSARRPTSA
jgi:hypothetical protein